MITDQTAKIEKNANQTPITKNNNEKTLDTKKLSRMHHQLSRMHQIRKQLVIIFIMGERQKQNYIK